MFRQKVTLTRWTLGPLALVLCGSAVNVAQAQRPAADPQAQRQQRREEMRNMTPEQRQQYYQQRMQERLKNMTPEQRQTFQQQQQQFAEQFAQRQEQRMVEAEVTTIQDSGYTDKEDQDAITTFIKEQKAARKPLLKLAQQLLAKLKEPDHGAAQTEALKTSLDAFRKAVADDKIRYEAALKELDAKVHYTTDPRMETLLTIMGVLGDEAAAVGGPSAISPQRGFGGFGGGFGGGRGGGGGQQPPAAQ